MARLTNQEIREGLHFDRVGTDKFKITVPERSSLYEARQMRGIFRICQMTGAYIESTARISPDTLEGISEGAIIGAESRLFGNNRVGARTILKHNVWLNNGAYVGSDSIIGAHSFIAPRSGTGDGVFFNNRVEITATGIHVESGSFVGERNKIGEEYRNVAGPLDIEGTGGGALYALKQA